MAQKGSIISIISLVVSLATLGLIVFLVAGEKSGSSTDKTTIAKELAGELADNNLYSAAIAEYKKVLEDPSLEKTSRANINYLIGETYYEHLGDYENAAAYLIRARSLNPEANFYNEAGRMLVTSLEKMGRMLDARRELDRAVNIDSVEAANQGKTLIARINEMPVYLDDVEEQLQMLPPEMQAEFDSPENKIKAVRNYIGEELIYRAAMREGYDRDPEVLKTTDLVNRKIVVEQFVSEKVLEDIKADPQEIQDFYEKNKESMFEGKPFEEISDRVVQAYQQQKVEKAFRDYVSRLMAVENVQIFEDKIK